MKVGESKEISTYFDHKPLLIGMKVFHYHIDRSNMFHCLNYRPFGRNMFAFLNVNHDQRGHHVHVDPGIIDCNNGGVRCFEVSRREYKNRNNRNYRNTRKTCFSKVGDFYQWWEAQKILSRRQKQTVGRVSGNKTFFFLGLIDF